MESLRILRLLLHKNFLMCKSQWKMSLFGEILVPFSLIVAIWALRNLSATSPTIVNTDTYYPTTTLKNMTESYPLQTAIVYYAPNNSFTNPLMKNVMECLRFDPLERELAGFATEKELLYNYEMNEMAEYAVNVVVIFDDKVNDSTKHLEYKIRTNAFSQDQLYEILDFDRLYNYYVVSNAFVTLQLCIDESFMKMKESNFNPEILVQRLPYPPYIKQSFDDAIYRQLFSAVIVIAFMIPLFIETSKASNEKFLGVNVLMSMNGVSNALNLLSWLISGFLFIGIFCILPIIIVLFFATGDALPYFNFGNPLIIWIVFNLHVLHLLAYGIHVSAYFNKSLHVIIGILILYVCSMVLQLHGFKESSYPIAPYLGILFPNLLLYRAIEELNYYETIAEGIQWNNLFIVGNEAYKIGGSMGMVLILSIIGIIFQFTLAVYVYEINPGKYGVRKHPLFFIKTKSETDVDDNMDNVECDEVDGKPFESVSEGIYTAGIQIRNLKKSYNVSLFSDSKVHALRGVSINFYKGQITSLLGHNGAGKTTMMSILTGMMSPSNGQVLINSKNIKHHAREIMNDMGLCTQENMLFPSLSVGKQLKFFAKLKNKGKTQAEVEESVKAFLEKLKLYDKRNSLPKELSGGQKRRVCLGMALVGNPSKMREHKTILISTHDMEEADILGDRIAILHMGQLRSYGTSMFLKKLMGQGNIEVTLSIKPSCDIERVRYELNCEAKIINEDGSQLVMSIPNSPDLPDSLDNVERKKQELDVSGLSVSLISLEQVFLKVTQDKDDLAKVLHPFRTPERILSGRELYLQFVRGLFLKKMSYTKRNLSTIALMLLLVIMALASISLIIRETGIINPPQKIISLKLDMYDQPEIYFKSYDGKLAKNYKLITESFRGKANEARDTSVNKALLNYAKKNLFYYDNHIIAAAEFNQTDKGIIANAFYSEKATFSFPISVNLLTNALVKTFLGDEYSISVSGQQLPSVDSLVYTDVTMVNGFTTAVIFVFLFFPAIAMFVLHPLRENSTGVKQLQRMTGVSCWTYWGTMIIFDVIVFLLIVVVIMIGFISMDFILELRLYEMKEILITLLLFVLFACNSLPLVYLFSFISSTASSAVRLLTYIPVGIVSLELIMYAVYKSLGHYESVKIIRPLQKRIFLLIPYVSFFHSQISFYLTAQKNSRCKRLPNNFYDTTCLRISYSDYCCERECYDGECKQYLGYFGNFHEDISLDESVVYMAITPILYIGILTILEYQLIQSWRARAIRHEEPQIPTDEQVKREEDSIYQQLTALDGHHLESVNGHIANGKTENSYDRDSKDKAFFVYQLRKRYAKLMAVKNVSFSINQRECFGLLGVNGAGKSTTFRMMSGSEIPDFGVMYIDDKSYTKDRKYFLSQMGYCPQNDAIIRSLNAYDHLRLFARLRGIPEDSVESEVNTWIERLNLKACASQPSRTYSGGNKRRLNIAIALIGIPKLVLLDEPTTGVDPGARRSLWNVIQSCQTTGQAVVLTSHSMEECEALCNRLAIMVGGKLVCIGPSQELKQRFGAGYDIQIKMNPEKSKDQINRLKNDMLQSLTCELVDENSGYLMYHVTPHEVTWRKMYTAMNVLKSKYDCIDDFSVLSSTLEQLFLLFARAANSDPSSPLKSE